MESGLYQTLSREKAPKKDLSAVQKRKLSKDITALEDEKSIRAVMSLICNHAKATGEDCGTLPYMLEDTDDGVKVDIKNLPRALRWILWKFMSIISTQS